MAETRKDRKARARPTLSGQVFPLLLGLVPTLMVLSLATKGGAGLHRLVWVAWGTACVGGLTSFSYHLAYRKKVPQTVIAPPAWWKSVIVALVVFLFGAMNLWGASTGWSLQLTPNRMESAQRWLQILAKMLLHEQATGEPVPAVFAPWVSGPSLLGGSLWSAVGFSCAFAMGGALASALRKEAFDPRQEPFGSSALWPVLRSLIGYYYGWALGFVFGAAIDLGLNLATGSISAYPPAVAALRNAFGAVGDPNLAFAMGLVSGSWLLSAAMVFLGKGDFTVAFTDPKPPEREPPMKVAIPPVPKAQLPDLDFSALAAETEQIAGAFGRELSEVVRRMGLTAAPSRATAMESPAAEPPADQEVPTVNLISARRPDFDLSFDQALGQFSSVYVQVTATLGQIPMSLADWITLQEGSLLEMPRSADGSITLCINGRTVGRAKPALHEGRVAVKVLKLEAGTVENLKGG